MESLLNQLTVKPPWHLAVWFGLLVIVAVSLLLIIVKVEDHESLRTIAKSVVVFAVSSIAFSIHNEYLHNKQNEAINNKQYTVKANGILLEVSSQSPYLSSKTFKIVYQDDDKIQVEYNSNYFNIDKSTEGLGNAN